MRTDQRIELGDGLEVSRQGFGGMALAGVYGSTDRATALQVLDHCVDIGVSFIDTADVYGSGENEELIADLLARRRDEVTIATKFGIVSNPADRPGETPRVRGDAEYVQAAVDRSLSRLGVESIDLYYLHRPDLSRPIEETVAAMAELVTAGKVRHLGLSEVAARELEAAVAVHPIAPVQSEWSIWSRDVEASVVPAASRLGVGVVPYSPLGRGFLTGTISERSVIASDFRAGISRFGEDNFAANSLIVDRISAIAASHDATAAQVALSWLYAKGAEFGVPVVPIPGTRSPLRVDENFAALDLSLVAGEVAELDRLAAAVVGSRSPNPDPSWTSEGRE